MRLQHPNPRAGQPYVQPEKYAAVRAAMLDLLPAEGPGETTEGLVARLLPRLPADGFPTAASVRWFVTAVRQDLEARGLILRAGRTRPVRYLRRALAVLHPTPVAGLIVRDWGGQP